MFDVFLGFHGHAFSGDPFKSPQLLFGLDHDCPGPMFDWHRFAREVWDWWWHPFDVDAALPATKPVAARPYSLASRDGSTRLNEYYWSTPVPTILGRKTTGIHGPHSSPSTFALPQGVRVYAMANGEVVAARFATASSDVDFSMLVVRHEVFHRLDPRPAAAAAASPGALPQFAGRIAYDVAPSSVFSIYLHLGRPAGIDFTNVSNTNPDWLNRMLVRMKEWNSGSASSTRQRARLHPLSRARSGIISARPTRGNQYAQLDWALLGSR